MLIHIHMLNDSAIEQGCGYIAVGEFLLRLIQAIQNDALFSIEPIADIRHIIFNGIRHGMIRF